MAASAVRKLVLFRHAKSAWPEVPDHERPLAPRGRRDAPAMGRWLRAAGHLPDQVLCSTACRARETWRLAHEELGVSPEVTFDSALYHGSAAQLLELIRHAPPAARTLLIVGHEPAISGLALTLAATELPAQAGDWAGVSPRAMLDRMTAKFPTAAIAILEFTGQWDRLAAGATRLAGFVTPSDVKASAKHGRGKP